MRAPSAGRLGVGRLSCPAARVPSTALLVPAGSPCARAQPQPGDANRHSVPSPRRVPRSRRKKLPRMHHPLPRPTLFPPAATRLPLRSPCHHLPPYVFGRGPRSPEPPVPLCPFAGLCQAGQGRRPSEGDVVLRSGKRRCWEQCACARVCVC